MNNKKLFAFLILGVFLLAFAPLASAATLTDPSTWDDEVTFHPTSDNGKFGYYEITDTFLWVFNKKQIKQVTLLENDYTVFEAWNIKEIEVFEPTKLFDKTSYYAKDKKTDKSNVINSEQQLYREWVTKTRYINVWGSCTLTETVSVNKTNSTDYSRCIEYEDLGYEEIYEDWTEWQEYKWGSVQPGLYQTKTIVTRDFRGSGIVDWIDTSEGHELKEWAAWWDTDWLYKRELSSLGTEDINALYSVIYDAHMKSDFGDIRFVDSATETTELEYGLVSKIDSTSAKYRIDSLGETTVMMYYGNAAVSTTESLGDVYFNPELGYNFDNANANDFTINGNDGALISSPTFISNSYIGGGYDFDGISKYVDSNLVHSVTSVNPISISAWFKTSDTTSQKSIAAAFREGGTNDPNIQLNVDGDVGFMYITAKGDGGTSFAGTGTTTINDNAWHHVLLVVTTTSQTLYLDGSSTPEISGTANTGDITLNGTNFYISSGNIRGIAKQFLDAELDEIYFYDKVLTSQERTKLYEQTNPSFITGVEQENSGLASNLISPDNNLITDIISQDFIIQSLPDGLTLKNLTMTIWNNTDNNIYLTNFTTLSGTVEINSTFTEILDDGNYSWGAETCATDDSCAVSSNRTLIIDTTPFINITYPTTGLNIASSELTVNVTLTEIYFDELILNLNYTNGTLANTTTITDSIRSFIFSNVVNGNYIVEAIVNTNTSQTNSTITGAFLVHTTTPQIFITAPTGIIPFIKIGESEQLNYSISEIGENITHFDECWFEYNNTEVLTNSSFTISPNPITWTYPTNYANVTQVTDGTTTLNNIPEECSRIGNFTLEITTSGFFDFAWNCLKGDGTYELISIESLPEQQTPNITAMQKRTLNCSDTTELFEYVPGKNGLCVHAIDEFGLHSENVTSWEYSFIEKSLEFNNDTLEGSSEKFTLNFTKASTLQVSKVDFIYDGNIESTKVILNGDEVSASLDFIIPNIDVASNKTFYFNVLFTDGSEFNSSSNNQSVGVLELDDCSAFTNKIFNFTLVDEESQLNFTLVDSENTTIELDIIFMPVGSNEVILQKSQQFDNVNPALICLNQDLDGIQYKTDVIAKYYGDFHSVEYYNIQSFIIENTSVPQNIILYDLLLDDSTEFQVSFRDDNGLFVEGAVILFNRQYVSEGIFKSVEAPETDNNGQTVAHLNEKDTVYNIVVSKEGVILATFNNIIPFCEDSTIGLCRINLIESEADTNFYNYDAEFEINYDASYNETLREIKFDFTTKDLTVKNVTVVIDKFDMLGGTTVDSESLSTASGTMILELPQSVGNSTFIARVYVDGVIMEQFVVDGTEQKPYGVFGYIAFFILLLSIFLMMSDSKTTLVIGGIIGFIFAALLSIIGTGGSGILGSVIWLVIAGFILIYKLNQGQGSN